MKKKFLIVLTIFISLFMLTSCSSDSNPYDSNNVSYEHEYAITSLSVDVKVNKDRSARVTEKYEVYYRVRSLGISRYLPYKNGELYRDIEVKGDVWFLTDEDNFLSVNLGAKNYSVLNPCYEEGTNKEYEISYTIVPPPKMRKGVEYYMNVVGHGWGTTISNVKVNMQFPYEIKSAQVFSGKYGTTTKKPNTTYTVEENNLSISAGLSSYEGITVKVQFDKKFGNYFDVASFIVILVLGAILVGTILYKKIKFSNETITPVVNFYPPKKDNRVITPAEAGYFVDGISDDEDITSQIFYFAAKGYIKIRNDDGQIVLERLVDSLPKSQPNHSVIIFEGLFYDVTSREKKKEVKVCDLAEKFYSVVFRAKVSVKSEQKKKLFIDQGKGVIVAGFAVLCAVAAAFAMILTTGFYFDAFILAVAFPVVFAFASARAIVLKKYKVKKSTYLKSWVFPLLFCALLCLGISLVTLKGTMDYLPRFFITALPTAIAFVAGCMQKRTKFYTEMLNQLLGFKDFLECAEKDQLETLIEDNPDYYYTTLSYANVLGVSDKWMEKFEDLTLPDPAFYQSAEPFHNTIMFNAAYRAVFATIRENSIAMPANANSFGRGGHGGGFSGGGGGFSGGGFGGGGGGRR